MRYELAPLEGITNYIVRNSYAHHFPGADYYFTPFIQASKGLSQKVKRDLDPSNNSDLQLIPQLMANKADDLLKMGRLIQDTYGYQTFNLNLGCPSGTVTAKGRGAGALLDLEALDAMLYQVYDEAPFDLSIKTRIGYAAPDEWPAIMDIYKKYPMAELIIHPRLREEFYKGKPHLDAFLAATDTISCPLIYNGDIVDLKSYHQILHHFPEIDGVMIGRGCLRNPALFEEIRTDQPLAEDDFRRRLLAFHDEILAGYQEIFSGEKDVTIHLKEIWASLSDSFCDIDKPLKKLRKSKTTEEYLIYARDIIQNAPLKCSNN